MLAHIFAEVDAFVGTAEVHDDMAVVVVCYGLRPSSPANLTQNGCDLLG
jgi:hypothetical protein